jgi:hypothetical protein
MRTLIGFLILCSPLVTHAADPSRCPNNIQIGYEGLIPVSEQKVERLRRNSNPEVYREAVRARDTIIRTAPEKVRNLAFKFSEDAGGVCSYKRNGGGEGRLEIFARAGISYLRAFLPFRGLEIYTDHELTRLSERDLKAVYRPTTPIEIKIGTRAYHVGWAYSLTLKP